MARNVSGRGHREAARAIRRLAQMQERPIGDASRHALQPILKAAKANLGSTTPLNYAGKPGGVQFGGLKKSLAIRKVKKVRKPNVQYHVTPTGRGVGKAHLVEFGTEPHWQPKRGVMHPGAKPFPFLTPAFEAHDDEAVDRFGKAYGPALERQAERLAKRR